MDGFLGIIRDLVNSSSEGFGDGDTATSEGNYCSMQTDATATKVKGKNSSSYIHAIIDRVFYKAIVVEVTVPVHNNYYHTLSKMFLN